jgi:hypothetical protein
MMTMNTQLIPVPFYNDTLLLVDESGAPFVPMKPVVTNMGLDWKSQHVKLTQNFGSVMAIITTTGADGKQYEMVCLPLRKLAAWLYSINPGKVKPELRDKIIQYQNECDDVLWDYWTKGAAIRPGALSVQQLLSTQRQARQLIFDLKHETLPIVRLALHHQLAQLCRLLGLDTPPLDGIGYAEAPSTTPAHLEAFWEAYEFLQGSGIAVNHSRNPELIALNLIHFEQAARDAGLRLPLLSEIRSSLRVSKSPRFQDIRAVNSAILDRAVKCWVFAPQLEVERGNHS